LNKEKPLSTFAGHKLSPKYEVFRGGRRWYAFLTKGLKIPARVIDVNDRDALWKAYEENAYRANLEPDEEAEHILRLIDAELKDTPEYAEVKNDPKKALAIAYDIKQGWTPKKRISCDVARNLRATLETLFASLPRTRKLTIETFYSHNLRVLKMPERTREKLREKEVRGSASAEEAIASIKDDFARDVVADWAAEKKRVPVRMLEKRAKMLNRNAKLLGEIKNGPKEKKIIEVALEKGFSPKMLELELQKLLPKPKEEDRLAPIENHDEMVQVYCPRDSISMPEVKDGSVRLIVTSPPYGGKIAFEGDYLSKAKTPNEYFSQVEPMVQEWFRKLMPGAKAVINWADPIGNWANKETTENGEYAEHIYAHKWVELAEKAGFKLWARQIWHKNVFYSIARRRVCYEDAVHTDGKTHLDWEWILTFRKPGPAPEGRSKLSYQKWKKYTKGVWYIKGARSSRGLAAFPPELVSRLIQLYSFKGDLVLDPFLGTGTTVAVAKKLGRRGVGYEINPDLKAEIKRTLELA
jgi:DNA modification methylase/ParB-like chromosome segregation protein Spo0J